MAVLTSFFSCAFSRIDSAVLFAVEGNADGCADSSRGNFLLRVRRGVALANSTEKLPQFLLRFFRKRHQYHFPLRAIENKFSAFYQRVRKPFIFSFALYDAL